MLVWLIQKLTFGSEGRFEKNERTRTHNFFHWYAIFELIETIGKQFKNQITELFVCELSY